MADTTKKASTGDKTPAVAVGRARNTGDIDALKRIHWLAVRTAYRLMKNAGTYQEQLSAVHAINQSSGSYVKLLETTDLKDEIGRLRTEISEMKREGGLKKVV